MTQDRLADEIAEDLLYRTGKAMSADVFDWVCECFDLPQIVETLDGKSLIETEDDLLRIFRNLRQYYAKHNVTDVARTVVTAEFIDAETIGMTHAAQLMRPGGEVFRAPYPVYSILRKFGEVWKIAGCSYAILDAPEHNRALIGRPNDEESDAAPETP